MIMTAVSTAGPALTEKEFEEAAKISRPVSDAGKVQALRAKTGMLIIVSSDIAILGVCILALWLTKASGDVAAATLTSAFSAIASMTSAYFGIRAASNVAQGLPSGTPSGAPGPQSTP